jgi:DNA-binding response OmpR family regulator
MLYSTGGTVAESALNERAVSVPSAQPRATGSFGVVLRLEARHTPSFDPVRLARAVEDLIQAIDPTLVGTRVEVELSDVGREPAPSVTALDRNPTPEADLELDVSGRTLVVDNRAVSLTRREFDLLAYLQDHRGVALSRGELMGQVWQSDYLVGDRTIDVHVRRLRVKLGRHADRLHTLRGFGYRLD